MEEWSEYRFPGRCSTRYFDRWLYVCDVRVRVSRGIAGMDQDIRVQWMR